MKFLNKLNTKYPTIKLDIEKSHVSRYGSVYKQQQIIHKNIKETDRQTFININSEYPTSIKKHYSVQTGFTNQKNLFNSKGFEHKTEELQKNV